MNETITVGGMTCENCVRHLRDALLDLPGVEGVQVDLASGLAVIETTVCTRPADAGFCARRGQLRALVTPISPEREPSTRTVRAVRSMTVSCVAHVERD